MVKNLRSFQCDPADRLGKTVLTVLASGDLIFESEYTTTPWVSQTHSYMTRSQRNRKFIPYRSHRGRQGLLSLSMAHRIYYLLDAKLGGTQISNTKIPITTHIKMHMTRRETKWKPMILGDLNERQSMCFFYIGFLHPLSRNMCNTMKSVVHRNIHT